MVEHRLHLLFATPIAAAQLGEPEMDAALETAILARRSAHPGSRHSNIGGWQSDMELLHWGGAAAQRLARAVVALADARTIDEAGGPKQDWNLEVWANVNEAGHGNLAHSHAGASGVYWSAVYYVRVPEGAGGELVFHDPRGPVVGMHGPSLHLKDAGGERRATLRPESGLLVLFPAWLVHSVLPWQGEAARISVAFNLAAEPRTRGRPVRAAALRG